MGRAGGENKDSSTFEYQPVWAKQLLRKKKQEEVEQDDARGVQPTGPIGGRPDLLRLVHQGDGGGVVVDEELAGMYPTCRRDIAGLISEGLVRHVLKLKEEGAGRGVRPKFADPRNHHPAIHRLRAAVLAVGGVPWLDLLGRHDRQGPGGVGFEEFAAAAKGRFRLGARTVSDEDLRAVFRLVSTDLSVRAELKDLVGLLEDDEQAPFPQKMVLFPRFEREAEAVRLDEDIREAFHAVPPVHAGESGARVAPRQEAAKQPRRVGNRKRKMQNTHMFGEEPL